MKYTHEHASLQMRISKEKCTFRVTFKRLLYCMRNFVCGKPNDVFPQGYMKKSKSMELNMCVLFAVSPARATESGLDSVLYILSINDYFKCIISLIYSERINKLCLLCRGKRHFYHLCYGEFLIYPFRFRILLGCNFALSLGIST